MLHAHVQSFLKRYLWCVCLLNFLDFDLHKAMFKFVNADLTQKSASEASAQIFESYLTYYATCVVFLDENWTFLK